MRSVAVHGEEGVDRLAGSGTVGVVVDGDDDVGWEAYDEHSVGIVAFVVGVVVLVVDDEHAWKELQDEK